MTEIETYAPRGSMLDPVTDSWVDTMGDVVNLAKFISRTEFVPESLRDKQNNDSGGARTAAAILTGRELGLPPMTALSSVHMVKGRPGISAEVMRGLVAQRGHEIRFVKVTSQEVTVRGRRAEDRGDDTAWTEVTWSMQDAQLAGLLASQPNYKKYPRQMLTARATTELCRLLFADVIHGLRSVEELEALAIDGEVVVEYAEETPEPTRSRPRREAKVQPVDAKAAEQGDGDEQPVAAQPATTRTTRTSRRSPSLTRRGSTSDAAAEEGSGQGVPSAGDGPPAAASQTPGAATPRDASAPPADEDESRSADTSATPAGAEQEPSTEGEGAASDPAPSSAPAEPQPDEDGAVDVEIVEEEPEPKPESEPMVTSAQVTKLVTVFNLLGVADRGERLYITSLLGGRQVESANHLTKAEASSVIDSLEQCKTNEDLQAIVSATAEHAEKGEQS